MHSDIVKSEKATRRFMKKRNFFSVNVIKLTAFSSNAKQDKREMVKLSCMKYETLTLYIEIIVASIENKKNRERDEEHET